MTLYVITAVRFDAVGDVERVKWARVDGMANKFEEEPHVVELDRIIEAFDRGDMVELVFSSEYGNVPGGRIVRKVLPNGHETIVEARQTNDRTLKDMPSF